MAAPLRPRDLRQLTVGELRASLGGAPLDDAVLRALLRDRRRAVRVLGARWRAQQARIAVETARLEALFTVESEYRAIGYRLIAGVDEVGVAPLAGPVLAAAVILPPEARFAHLNDSKLLTPEMRTRVYADVARVATAISIAQASVDEIDTLNVLQATRLAHRRAIEGLRQRPHLVLIDGRYAAEVPIAQLVIVDGDATCASIAAASVVAKVTRDRMMEDLAERYPQYGFARHKGYGTRAHLEAIRRFGLTPVHRRSFAPLRAAQELLPIG